MTNRTINTVGEAKEITLLEELAKLYDELRRIDDHYCPEVLTCQICLARTNEMDGIKKAIDIIKKHMLMEINILRDSADGEIIDLTNEGWGKIKSFTLPLNPNFKKMAHIKGNHEQQKK